jgi:uncharacterized membrane protein YfbV (UPF0208 family)
MGYLRQARMTRSAARPGQQRFVPFVAAFAVLRRIIFGAGVAELSHSKQKLSAASAASALSFFVPVGFGASAIFRLAFPLLPALAWRPDFTRKKSFNKLSEQVLA